MKPKADPAAAKRKQRRLLADDRPLLKDFIDMKHELVLLADLIQWETFENHWRDQFGTAAGPMASAGRRVAGLLMLQHMEGLSDERLIAAWVSNPYYQYFCGEIRFQHRPPINPTTLVKWRKRLGEEGMEWLLTTVLQSAIAAGALDKGSLAHVCVDSLALILGRHFLGRHEWIS